MIILEINKIYNSWLGFEKREQEFKNKKDKYKNLDEKDVVRIEELISRYSSVENLYNLMDNFSKRFIQFKDKKPKILDEVIVSKNNLLKVVKDIKRCPVCYSEVDDKKAEEIVERS